MLNKKYKVMSLFSGLGAFEKGLDKLGVDYEVVNFCEIDKYASKAYSLIHEVPESLNLGDITKVDENTLPDADILVFGSPCQDFSVAGGQAGAMWKCKDCGHSFNPLHVHHSKRNTCPECGSTSLNKTRSSLVCEGLRIIKAKRPDYIVYENVKNLVSKKFITSFNYFIKELEEYGYDVKYKVLNAKDYGVPQNRERVFVVATKKNLNIDYKFPKGFALDKCIADIVEADVDIKYYLSEDKQKRFKAYDKMKGSRVGPVKKHEDSIGQREEVYFKDGVMGTIMATDYKGPKLILEGNIEGYAYNELGRVYDVKGICPTLTTMQGGDRQPKILIRAGEIEGLKFKQDSRVYHKDGIAPTILANSQQIIYDEDARIIGYERFPLKFLNRNGRNTDGQYTYCIDTCHTGGLKEIYNNNNFKIRKLTPKECFRLMGFDDKDHDILVQNKISDTQRYKQAGNSIVVDTLVYIFKNLLL